MTLILISVALVISIAANAFLFYRQRTNKNKPTQDAKALLHDLTRYGSAVIKITVIDADNLILRSPRDYR